MMDWPNAASGGVRMPHSHASTTLTNVDLDRGGHAGRKDDARRRLIDLNANRNPLGQTHPCEDRIDAGDPLSGGLRVRDIDGVSDTVDVTAQDLAVPHQLNACRI